MGYLLGSIASLLRTIQRTARHTTAIWRGQKICENKARCVTDNINCIQVGVFLFHEGGGTPDFRRRDERGNWIGLKFLILGFLGVGKMRTFLCRGRGGTLDLSLK